MTKPATPIRLMIVDDHPLVRMGLVSVCRTQSDMAVVADAGNAEEAERLVRLHRPDIVLMDIQLPGVRGIELTSRLLGEFPEMRVIMLTNLEGDEDMYQAFQAGARSYLLKDMPAEVVLTAIRAVHRGERHVPAAVANRLVERIGGLELTSRELEVLEKLATGLSNKAIGTALGITEGTVKLHVKSILSKLNVTDRTQAVTVAHRRGIIHLS